MEGLIIDAFRVILKHLDSKDLCLAATVNKRWCYEVNSPSLWRDLFMKYMEQNPDNMDEEMEAKFRNLLRTTTLPQINNDWKRAFIIKSTYEYANQERVWCLSECAIVAEHHMPQLENHEMGPFAHQPLMFEQFATKVVDYPDPPSSDHDRCLNIDEPCPGLFQQVSKMLGDDLSRAWMIVDASRAEDLTQILSKETNAIFTTLMGSFFNLTNVNNFPYLVKVSSCLTFCEHVYDTSGGNWCYIIVEHPSLHNHLDDVWYLNIDPNLYPNKEMKTMAVLRRHFMKMCMWFENFLRLGELQNIIMMLHIYEQSVRDELFSEISTNPLSNYPIKTPIVDYYLLIDEKKKFFSEKISVIRPDFVPIKVSLNGKKEETTTLINEYVILSFLFRAEPLVKEELPHLADQDMIPQLRILYDQAQSYGLTSVRDQIQYFTWYYTYPSFTENTAIKELLENTEEDNDIRIQLIDEIVDQLIPTNDDE